MTYMQYDQKHLKRRKFPSTGHSALITKCRLIFKIVVNDTSG